MTNFKSMAGLSYPSEGQSHMESTMSKDWTQNSVTHHHPMTPQIESSSQSQALLNNWTQCPTQHNTFSTDNFVPESSSITPTTVFEAMVDDSHIEECLNRPLSLPYQLQHHAMNENEQKASRHQGGCRNISSNYMTSTYRGVTKCNENRYEAFVRDHTIQGERGRTVYIGGYLTEIEAARAYDLVSIKIGGISTPTNFPVSCYWKEICEMQNMSLRDYIHVVRRKGKGFTDTDSPYRGVYSNRILGSRTWQARLGQHDRGIRSIYLGTYYTAEDAARAYDIASIKMKGKAAITNFDLNSYDIKGIMDSVSAFTTSLWRTQTQMADNCNEVIFQSSTETNGHKPNPYKGEKPKNNPSQQDQQHNPQNQDNSSSFHGYQQPNPIPNNPYIIGVSRFTSTRINDNSSGNYEATLQQSPLIGTGLDFQASQQLQALQNLMNVNNNDFEPQNLVNNQVLEQSPSLPLLQGSLQSLELQNYLSFPNGPYDFGTQLLGETMESLSTTLNGESSNQVVNGSLGASNGGGYSFGLQSREIHPVEPNNQGSEVAQLQLPALDQSFECYNNYHPKDALNQNPSQNLNAGLSYCFQNPSSGANNGFQSQMIGEIQDDFDISQYLNSSYMEQNDCTNI